SSVLILPSDASFTSPFGMRKLRAYPSDTFLTSPFLPCPFTSCRKITFIRITPLPYRFRRESASASPPLPSRRLLTEQPHSSDGRRRPCVPSQPARSYGRATGR